MQSSNIRSSLESIASRTAQLTLQQKPTFSEVTSKKPPRSVGAKVDAKSCNSSLQLRSSKQASRNATSTMDSRMAKDNTPDFVSCSPIESGVRFGAFRDDFHTRAEQAKMILTRPEELSTMQFPQAATKWIEYKTFNSPTGRARFVSPRSIVDLKQYVATLGRVFSRSKLCEIHAGHIRQYQLDRAAGKLAPEGKPEREVGPNKINQEVGTLIRIMKFAHCWTPQLEEAYQPLQREESDIPRALSPSEQTHWLNVASSHPDFYFVFWYSLIGFDCPMSTNEERGLRIGDVDLNNNIVMVRVRNSKNKYRTRTIPLSDSARWAMDRIMDRAREAGSNSPQHFLMPFRKKHVWVPEKPMTVSGIKKPWDAVRKAAGLEWFTPYGLRHTSITRYAEAGTPIPTIMSMAGHISRKMMEHYTWISEQAKRRAVQNVSAKSVVLGRGA